MNDSEAVKASQNGDREAFEGLIQRHYRSVYALAYQCTGCHHEADDICQKTFLRAFDRIVALKDATAFRSWLFAIAVNMFRQQYRRAKDKDMGCEPNESVPDPMAQPPWHHLSDRERISQVQVQIQALPEPMRMAMVLVHLEGLTQKEAAGVLKCSEATLSRHLVAAMARLRSRLLHLI